MKIQSSVFGNGREIPREYSCDGHGKNPPLTFSEMPDGVKSLALIVDDPDAPSGDFVHWLLWNIDPKTSSIKEGEEPEGANKGMTSAGKTKYVSPCPPSGTHRYFFKLYALDVTLDLADGSDKGDLLQAMEGHILEEAELLGNYNRN